MLSAAILLLLHGMYAVLRVSGGTGSFPRPLSAKEEQGYLEKLAQGDKDARNVLIEHNLRLVAHIIKKYYTMSSDQDDLISIGAIGLIKGISSYDPGKGTRLATYAARCIENEILMYFRSQKKVSSEVSLSDPINTDREGNTLSLLDVICSEDCVLEKIDAGENEALLYKYVDSCLSEREKRIIKLRYGLGGVQPQTQRKIANACGISRSYVSRIEKKALKKLETEFQKKK